MIFRRLWHVLNLIYDGPKWSEIHLLTFKALRPKKKIGVFTVCRPTLFYSCRPYHFFYKNKKTRLLSDPARAVPDFSTGIQIFRRFYSIPYVGKPFTDTFGFCQSKMATFSSLFVSKNVITKIRKACLKQQVITRWLEIFNDNYPCDGVFLLWVYFPLLLLDVVNRGLELSEERKLNTFITDYIDSHFIIYKSARYVPFVHCRR